MILDIDKELPELIECVEKLFPNNKVSFNLKHIKKSNQHEACFQITLNKGWSEQFYFCQGEGITMDYALQNLLENFNKMCQTMIIEITEAQKKYEQTTNDKLKIINDIRNRNNEV